MRDLLWRCDEHRGPDADFPAFQCWTVFLGEIGLRVFGVAAQRAIPTGCPLGGRVTGEELEGRPEPEITLRRVGHDGQP